MVSISPLKINVEDDVLDDLYSRLANTRWPGNVTGTGWSRGTDLDYLKEFVEYWIEEFDWRQQEARLNQLNHFSASVDGFSIHFIHEKGEGNNPIPLFMMHGYPWSFILLEKILPMLTHPSRFGGNPEDSFDVIVPSIIGFGFSEYPNRQSFGFQHHPVVYDQLLRDGLGYKKYAIEGGDWGGFLTAPWGYQLPENLIGIHLNCLFPRLVTNANRRTKILICFEVLG